MVADLLDLHVFVSNEKKQRIVDKEIHKNPKLVKMFPKKQKTKRF